MEIFPNSEVKVLKRAPVDKTNYHTILFSNATEQYNTFSAYAVKNFSVLTYQRHDAGVINVQAQMAEIYDCNYLMFRNSSFENKWFYAFIDDVEYVNNVTARIYYTIDVIQTWMFDLTLGDSFVVREHSETDNPGDNLVDEKIPVGEYEYGAARWFNSGDITLSDMCVVLLVRNNIWDQMLQYIPDLVPEVKTSGMYSGVYQGCMFVTVPATPANMDKLYQLAKNVDFFTSGGVVNVFMCPTMFVPVSNENSPSVPGKYINRKYFMDVENPTSLVGYAPRNKKLLTYPYNCLNVTVGGTTTQDYAYEYFDKGYSKSLTLETCFSANPSLMVFPTHYLGTLQYLQGAVYHDNYPVCAWSFDGFAEWMNNEFFRTFASVAILGATASAGVPYVPNLGSSASNTIQPSTLALPAGPALPPSQALAPIFTTGTESPLSVHSGRQPSRARTNYPNAGGELIADLAALAILTCKPSPRINCGARGGVLFGNGAGNEVYVWQKSILPYEAKIIDDYFDRYGYATNTVKSINRKSRKGWNYIRTNEAKIIGTAPARVEEEFRRIHDRGITYWHKPSRFMDYSQDNSPVAMG